MAVRYNQPFSQFCDNNGNPLAGGFLEFYVTESSDAKDIWEDDLLTIPAQNIDPNVVGSTGYELDSAGRCPSDIFLEPGDYKVILKDADGVILDTQDPVHGGCSYSGSAPYIPIDIFFNTKPTNAEFYPAKNIVEPMRLPANLTGSIFTVDASALPTATATFTLYKNGVSIGTIAFATTGVPTVTFASAVDFAIGDQFSVIAPATADATMNFIALNFKATPL